MSVTIEKTLHLPSEQAEKLDEFARSHSTSQDDVVVRALDLLFSMSEGTPEEERMMWHRLGAASLERVWDNPFDARYDNWKELYGVHEG